MFENLDLGALIIYVSIAMVFFIIGYFRALRSVAHLLASEIIKENQPALPVDLEIEKLQGQYYAYAPDSEFLAQGKDFKDLIENIKARFPDRKFKLAKFDAQWTEEETQKFVTALKDYLHSNQNETSR